MSDIRIRRSHAFPPAEAKKAADKIATGLKDRFGLAGHWKGSAMHFSGPGIDGVMRLEEGSVEIEAKLGFMLALMKPAIESSIHENLDRLFAAAAKPAGGKPAAKKPPARKKAR